MTRRLALAAALALLPLTAAPLAEPDPTVLAAVKAQDRPLRATLAEIVNVDTGTGQVPGLNTVEAILRARLEAVGATVEARPAPPRPLAATH